MRRGLPVKRRTGFRLAWGTCALTLALISCFAELAVLGHRGFDNVSFSIVGTNR